MGYDRGDRSMSRGRSNFSGNRGGGGRFRRQDGDGGHFDRRDRGGFRGRGRDEGQFQKRGGGGFRGRGRDEGQFRERGRGGFRGRGGDEGQFRERGGFRGRGEGQFQGRGGRQFRSRGSIGGRQFRGRGDGNDRGRTSRGRFGGDRGRGRPQDSYDGSQKFKKNKFPSKFDEEEQSDEESNVSSIEDDSNDSLDEAMSYNEPKLRINRKSLNDDEDSSENDIDEETLDRIRSTKRAIAKTLAKGTHKDKKSESLAGKKATGRSKREVAQEETESDCPSDDVSADTLDDTDEESDAEDVTDVEKPRHLKRRKNAVGVQKLSADKKKSKKRLVSNGGANTDATTKRTHEECPDAEESESGGDTPRKNRQSEKLKKKEEKRSKKSKIAKFKPPFLTSISLIRNAEDGTRVYVRCLPIDIGEEELRGLAPEAIAFNYCGKAYSPLVGVVFTFKEKDHANEFMKKINEMRFYQNKPVSARVFTGFGSLRDNVRDTLYVGGLPETASKQSLSKLFPESKSMVLERHKKGIVEEIYAFVRFEDPAIVKKYLDTEEKLTLDGRQLILDHALEKRKETDEGQLDLRTLIIDNLPVKAAANSLKPLFPSAERFFFPKGARKHGSQKPNQAFAYFCSEEDAAEALKANLMATLDGRQLRVAFKMTSKLCQGETGQFFDYLDSIPSDASPVKRKANDVAVDNSITKKRKKGRNTRGKKKEKHEPIAQETQ